ncbi:MAG: DUF4416 family protein [Candidatus Sabulitectum sp.]|nr:DUF4416 family protein [Candidatus Sabulitectum sp.]
MSLPEPAPRVLPVTSVLYGDSVFLKEALDSLQILFGEIVLFSEPFPFDMTDYYQDEMGASIQRVWLCFAPLQDPSQLTVWKEKCIEIEEILGGDGKRLVNIDPGYLDHGKLVLASCKAAPDKIYLGRGVFAHTCLRYRRGEFHGPEHSFADFIDGRFDVFFHSAKALLRKLLRGQGQ